MEIIFYSFSIILIISSFFVILSKKPIYALIYMLVTLLSTACIFFSLGAYFVAVLEIIIYAGAVMVIFIFVIMMFNINITNTSNISFKDIIYKWKQISIPILFMSILIYSILTTDINTNNFCRKFFTIKDIGITLFGSYILIVELISILLLAGLLVALHFGYKEKNNF